MRFLFIDEELCWPPETGKKIRTFNLLRELAHKHQIDLLCHPKSAELDEVAEEALASNGIYPHLAPSRLRPTSGPVFYWDLLRNLGSSLPYSVVKHYHPAFQTCLDEMMRASHYDVVVAEWGPYFHYLRDCHDVSRTVCMHNVESTIWQRYYEVERNPVKRFYIGKQWKKMARFERDLASQAELLFMVSEEDSRRIKELQPKATAVVVPNGVDLERFARDGTPEAPESLIFVGSMDWRPNDDGVRWFIAKVMPLVWQKKPEVTFTVCGRGPSAELRRLAEAARGSVNVTGSVEDVRPYAQKAQVSVVPLRVGGGSRLKILEAWAMGKPVVSTAVGAEGLTGKPGVHYLSADSPADLAAAVVELMDNPNRRNELGKAGRRLVEIEYSWAILGEKMAGYLEELARRSAQAEMSRK